VANYDGSREKKPVRRVDHMKDPKLSEKQDAHGTKVDYQDSVKMTKIIWIRNENEFVRGQMLD